MEKRFIRKHLWKDPSIIEDIFPDQEWQSHEGDPNQITPSTKMAQYIRDEINKESEPEGSHYNSKIHLKRVTYYAAASVILLLSLGIWFWIKPATYINRPNLVEQQKNQVLKRIRPGFHSQTTRYPSRHIPYQTALKSDYLRKVPSATQNISAIRIASST